MSLTVVLPDIQTLSRADKIRLIQFLAEDLARDEPLPIEAGPAYPVWSPDRAFRAANALLEALKDDRCRP